jgi:hypothetical protein
VPPISNLWNYTRMGFDLVTFSGGKGIRGPQNAGWFERKHPAVLQPARLASYTEHSSFMRKSELMLRPGMQGPVRGFSRSSFAGKWSDGESPKGR